MKPVPKPKRAPKPSVASILLGTAIATIITGRSSPSSAAPKPSPKPSPSPSPSNLPWVPSAPTVPSVPTEQPRPRAPSQEFKFVALHRYEIVADVLPVDGVGLREVATRALVHLRFDDGALKTYKTVERAGVEVTRVTFHANSIINNLIAIGRQYSIAGVGSVWLVSAKEVGP